MSWPTGIKLLVELQLTLSLGSFPNKTLLTCTLGKAAVWILLVKSDVTLTLLVGHILTIFCNRLRFIFLLSWLCFNYLPINVINMSLCSAYYCTLRQHLLTCKVNRYTNIKEHVTSLLEPHYITESKIDDHVTTHGRIIHFAFRRAVTSSIGGFEHCYYFSKSWNQNTYFTLSTMLPC